MKKLTLFLLISLLANLNISLANAEDPRPCSVFPASVTPECVAENLAYEKQRQEAYEAQQKAAQEEAKRAEAANTQKQFEESGSRACSVYPASLTPECVAENLAYEQGRQAEHLAEQKAKQEAAKKAAEEQAQKDYIANGSRPCSLYPASITPECVKENLKFEDNRKITNELTQKLKLLNTVVTANKIALPASNKIIEKYSVATPKVCKVSGNSVIKLKNGVCEIKVSYVTDQKFTVEESKKITFKK